jgi:hypothetical protein
LDQRIQVGRTTEKLQNYFKCFLLGCVKFFDLDQDPPKILDLDLDLVGTGHFLKKQITGMYLKRR